jgi:hypothetical protein
MASQPSLAFERASGVWWGTSAVRARRPFDFAIEEAAIMKPIRSLTLAFLFVATAVALAQSAAQQRRITIEVSLPNGATPRLIIADGGTGTVTTLQDAAGVVRIELFDMNRTPHRQMGQLDATVGGASVHFDTTPRFGVRVLRVVTR